MLLFLPERTEYEVNSIVVLLVTMNILYVRFIWFTLRDVLCTIWHKCFLHTRLFNMPAFGKFIKSNACTITKLLRKYEYVKKYMRLNNSTFVVNLYSDAEM